MYNVLTCLAFVSIFVGSILCLIAGVGFWRVQGFYNRLHIAGVVDSSATLFIMGGLALVHGLKPLLILLIMYMNSTTGASILANAKLLRSNHNDAPDQ